MPGWTIRLSLCSCLAATFAGPGFCQPYTFTRIVAPVKVPVTETMPGVFSADASGSGPGAIQNADGSTNGPGNGAAAGSAVVLYVSGLGRVSPGEPDGGITPTANIPRLFFPVTVTIGGQPSQILYQGPAPGAIYGLYQINCVIPAGVAAGNAAVVVAANGTSSQPKLSVTVK